MYLAAKISLAEPAEEHLRRPEYFCATADLKITALVAGIVAGADSIDDMALLRPGVIEKVFSCRICSVDPRLIPKHLRNRSCPQARNHHPAVAVDFAGTTPIVASIDNYALPVVITRLTPSAL